MKVFYVKKDINDSRNWPSVKGKVLKSNLIASSGNNRNYSHYYAPQITYTYTVNNKNYTSQRIALGMRAFVRTSEIYERYLERYPKDSVVNVYYNSANPEIALLELGVANLTWYYVFAVLSVLCGIFLLINYFTGFGDSFIENNFCRER